MFVNFATYSLVIVVFLFYVNSELCLTRSTVTKRLLKKRWTTIGEAKIIQKCCEGYSQENYNGGIICTPLCKSNCMNGYCDKPEECVCYFGYSNQNNTCVPVCVKECSHGTCIAPDMCLCYPGYNLVNETCLPRCTKPCGNGTCVAPDTCECDDGYYKSMFQHTNITCQPRCSAGCPLHSYCDAPESCKCNPGWRLNEINSRECLPTCKYPCGNGTCADRDVCVCFPGFRINYFRYYGHEPGPVCVPICENCTGVDGVGSFEQWLRLRSNVYSTTTTRSPLILMSTTTTSTTTTSTSTTTRTPTTTSTSTTTSTTTTPYFVSSSSSTEGVLDNNQNNNVTSADPGGKTWLQRNGIFIWLPILLIFLIIVLLLLRKDIINSFKGVKNRRSYNIKAAFRKRAASGPFRRQPPQDVKEAQV